MYSSNPFDDELLNNQGAPMPPVGDMTEQLSKDRPFRCALSYKNYLLLEKESTARGIKPFNLVKSVLTLYLYKQLVYVKELPEELQAQIAAHFKNTNQPLVL